MLRLHRRTHAALWRWLGPVLPIIVIGVLAMKLTQRPLPASGPIAATDRVGGASQP